MAKNNNEVAEISPDSSFEELAFFAAKNQAQVLSTAFLDDDDYTFLEDKTQLVNAEFIITKVQFGDSANFGEFAKVWVITKNTNSRVKFIDFSTGVKNQLLTFDRPDITWIQDDPKRGVLVHCRNGLVKSEYPANDVRPAGTTFYLDTTGGNLPAGTL